MKVTFEEAMAIGNTLNINYEVVSLKQWRNALKVELEHKDITGGDLLLTGRIALAHLKEYPDYYRRLEELERQAKIYWRGKSKPKITL